MSLTDRDRKILLALIPLAVVIAYWFLLLAPKRQEAASVKSDLTAAQGIRDAAQQKASQLAGAKRSFSADYATVIRLGKSIPTSVDMPSLLVQLDRASRGTGIKFADIKVGERTAAPTAAAATTTTTPPGGASGPTAPGAAPAQSAPGQAAQSAGNAVSSANGNTAAGAAAAGSAPAGSDPNAAAAAGEPGLETVPLDFEFEGSYFQLADFFHRMKRFVRVANNKIVIRGRLITIDSFTFDAPAFPKLKAQVHATVYLAPKAQGVDAGATSQGPATPAAAAPQTASSSPSIPTPAATVTPR
jgi:Tfp pilus assembly protein PilO